MSDIDQFRTGPWQKLAAMHRELTEIPDTPEVDWRAVATDLAWLLLDIQSRVTGLHFDVGDMVDKHLRTIREAGLLKVE